MIVFPATSMGHTASAQGVFEGIPVAAQAKKHEGENHEGDKHEACDSKPKVSFRKTIIGVHRDVGYFFAGLTVLYAISGVAVNHIEDWNPNYSVTHTERSVGDLGGRGRWLLIAGTAIPLIFLLLKT